MTKQKMREKNMLGHIMRIKSEMFGDKPPQYKSPYPIREFVYDAWNGVMNMERNPLRHIPHLQTRHMILQILAWVWCCTFAQLIGSWYIFGFSALAHLILLGTIAITVATFETAKRNPSFFIRDGYHTPSRSRSLWFNGKKVKLDDDDKGGEHE